MSIDQLARQLNSKRKQCTDVRNRIVGYSKTVADETSKAEKAAQTAMKSKVASTVQRKLNEARRHRNRASDALSRQAAYEKRLSSLESDASNLEKKLNEARIAEEKRLDRETQETSRKLKDIKPMEINLNAPLVTGDNYGNVAVGDKVQQQLSISNNDEVSERYQELESLLDRISDELDEWGLDAAAARPLASEIDVLKGQIHAEKPDDTLISRSFNAVKGMLAPIGMGLSTGVSTGVSERVREFIVSLQSLSF